VDVAAVQTNMVFVGVADHAALPLAGFLKERGILVFAQEKLRLVTHLDITAADVETVIAAFRDFFA
jgi:threonine aldolase